RYLAFMLVAALAMTAFRTAYNPTTAAGAAQGPVPRNKLVLAFYYMWYGPGDFDKGQMSDRPASPYISDHADVIERQVSEAKGAGIDAFISSWTGTDTETDKSLPALLDTAAKHDFHATIYFETGSAMQHGDVVSQLKSAERLIDHQAFLRWN